jgi:hypothetical protein
MCAALRVWLANPTPFISSIFSIAGSTQERRGRLVKAALFARRASGRSAAQSLDWPPALRTIPSGKMGGSLVLLLPLRPRNHTPTRRFAPSATVRYVNRRPSRINVFTRWMPAAVLPFTNGNGRDTRKI